MTIDKYYLINELKKTLKKLHKVLFEIQLTCYFFLKLSESGACGAIRYLRGGLNTFIVPYNQIVNYFRSPVIK